MRKKRKTVAIIGTNGIPAKYGGFETLAEHLVTNLSDNFDFVVYCSINNSKDKASSYKGAKLIYLPFKANGWQSVVYDLISIIHSLLKFDTLLVLGLPAGFFLFLNVIFRRNIVINHGGFNEWERPKYSKLARLWSYNSRKVAVKFANTNVGDNPIIIDSLKKNFNVNGKVIEYGGDHTTRIIKNEEDIKKYHFLEKEYSICVARAQVDNKLHMVIDAYKELPNHTVVIVSNWSVSKYGIDLYNKYRNKYSNIILLDAIYDQRSLNLLRSNASIYIHSHSFCGTSPSLVEAMNLGLPILSYDVPTNRYTTNNKAYYFSSAEVLQSIIKKTDNDALEANKQEMVRISFERYNWKRVASLYSEVI